LGSRWQVATPLGRAAPGRRRPAAAAARKSLSGAASTACLHACRPPDGRACSLASPTAPARLIVRAAALGPRTKAWAKDDVKRRKQARAELAQSQSRGNAGPGQRRGAACKSGVKAGASSPTLEARTCTQPPAAASYQRPCAGCQRPAAWTWADAVVELPKSLSQVFRLAPCCCWAGRSSCERRLVWLSVVSAFAARLDSIVAIAAMLCLAPPGDPLAPLPELSRQPACSTHTQAARGRGGGADHRRGFRPRGCWGCWAAVCPGAQR
jgi:hypothetical protein